MAVESKEKIIQKFRNSDKDTGSSEVQVAILTNRIHDLTGHLQQNKHDYSAKKGLLKLVAQRSKFLRYLERTNYPSYTKLIKKLKLKK